MKSILFGISLFLLVSGTSWASPFYTFELRFIDPMQDWTPAQNTLDDRGLSGSLWDSLVTGLLGSPNRQEWRWEREAGSDFNVYGDKGDKGWGGIQNYVNFWNRNDGPWHGPNGHKEPGGFDIGFEARPVPEPATMFLLGAGLSIMGMSARRRVQRSHA